VVRVIPSLLIATASLVAITACAVSPATPSTPTQPTAATPPPTASAEPALEPVADPADPSTWLIDAEGIGPVQLGMTLDEAVAAMPGYDVGTCPNPNVRYLASGDAAGTLVGLASDDNGNVALVSVTDSDGPATADGIHIGSTVADVKAAYADLELSQKYVDRYTLEDTPGFITFSTENPDAADEAPIFSISVVTGGMPPWELCG
jgi:hypothetical protein